MEKDIEAFRKQVMRWRGERRRGARRYPERMRAMALQLWDRLRRDGVTADRAAKRIGISTVTLRLWRDGTGTPGLVPVQVIPETDGPTVRSCVHLLSPRGYRIEVGDVATAVTLLRELG